jgi:hypothetical protein
MAPKKKAAVTDGGKQVRAKVDHTQPGTLTYRAADEVFVHDGEPYEHVEPVDEPEEIKEEE